MTVQGGGLTIRALGIRILIRADAELSRRLRYAWRDLLQMDDGGPHTIELRFDAGVAVEHALATLTATAVAATPHLAFHAAVVSSAGAVVAVPGQSGMGKTTLSGALLRVGYAYRSDEVLAVDRTSTQTVAFPRPLALTSEAWGVLALDANTRPTAGTEVHVDPRLLGGVDGTARPVTDVILAARSDQGPARLEQCEPGAAAVPLLRSSFNHYSDPANSFHTTVALLRACRVWRASYSNAADLAVLVRQTIG
ncbi:MAG TPA: hypothetical protein VGH11_16495 [Jatrophihabitans sp.]